MADRPVASVPADRRRRLSPRHRADLLAVLFLLALTAGFFGRVLVTDRVLLPTDSLYAQLPWSAFRADVGVEVPHNELIGDMIVQNYAWKSLIKSSYARGEFPLWNPYLFSGVPFLAAGQYAALYPPGVLFLILPVERAYGWFTALHVWLAGLFLYTFLRVLRARPVGALVGAVAFMFCGFLTVSYLWPMVVSTAVWAPLLLALIELAIRPFERGRPRPLIGALPWLIAGAIATGMQFLAGHLEISFYVLFTMAFYAAARLIALIGAERRWRAGIGAGTALAVMVALGFGVAMAQLWPFLELIQANFRSGFVSYQDVVGYALPWKHVAAFVMPDVFGNPTHHAFFNWLSLQVEPVIGSKDAGGFPRSYPFWGVKNYVEGAAYVGLLPLLAAPLAWVWRRDRYTVIFTVYAALSLLFAFGTPIFRVLWIIPGFDQLHTPFRWIFPYTISVAVLGGLGISGAIGAAQAGRLIGPARTARVRLTWALPVLACGGGIGLVTAVIVSRIAVGPVLDLAARALDRSLLLRNAFPTPDLLYSYQATNLLKLGLILAATGAAIWWALRGRAAGPGLRRHAGQVAIVGVLALDVVIAGYDFNTVSDPKLLSFVPPSVERLRQDPGVFRIVSFNQDDTLRPNTGMLAGLQDVRGYDTVIPRQYVEYWGLMEPPQGLLYSMIHKLVDPASLTSVWLDLLNVKYVLTTQNIGLPGLREVYRGEIVIYENEDHLPRAFLVDRAIVAPDDPHEVMRAGAFDPRTTVLLDREPAGGLLLGQGGDTTRRPEGRASIVSHQPNRVVVDVAAAGPSYLVLTDSYFDGWIAEIDGTRTELFRADAIFRAVAVPAGDHQVVFRYAPPAFRNGLFVSFISLLTLALGGAFLAWRRLIGHQEAASTAQRVARNSLTPMLAQLVNKLVDFGFAVLTLRLLGPIDAGKLAFAVVVIGYFSIFTDFGLGTLLTRDVARDRSQANRYLSNTLALRLWLCLASTPLLLGLIWLYSGRFDLTSDTGWAIAIYAIGLIPSAVSAALSSIFSAHERMEYPAAISVMTTLLKVSFGAAVLLAGYGIIGLASVSVVVNLITATVFFFLVRSTFFAPRWEPDSTFQRSMVGAAYPLMLNNFLSTIFFRIDVLLLKPMRGDRDVGYYSTAYKFVDGLNIIPSFFTLALFPVFARYADDSREALREAFHLALKVLILIALPISVGTTLIADHIIHLFFAAEFDPSIDALRILIWFLPFSYINSVTHYVLIAVNQQRFLTIAFIIGATFNIVGNLIAIPLFGLNGAAAMTIISETVLMLPFFYGVYRHVGSVPLVGLFWRPVIAGAAMGAVVWWLHDTNLPLIVAGAAATYLPLLLLLRPFTVRERQALGRAFRRRAGG